MASSDEEDLEALRLAALATLKPKAEPEPQGIQVLSLPKTNAQAPPPQDEVSYFGYGDVPPEFAHMALQAPSQVRPPPPWQFQQGVFANQQQRFANQQQRFPNQQQRFPNQQQRFPNQQAFPNQQGFTRGFRPGFQLRGRGRGRGGRGRGFHQFQPPPPANSALIVIPVAREEGPAQVNPTVNASSSSSSKSFFLRPQDKWAATGNSAAPPSPEKPKDKSKFSRYDDDTDSEDDDEENRKKRRQRNDDDADDNEVDYTNPENYEVEVHRKPDELENDLEDVSDVRIEIHNTDSVNNETEKDTSQNNLNETLANTSDNIAIREGDIDTDRENKLLETADAHTSDTVLSEKTNEVSDLRKVHIVTINETDNDSVQPESSQTEEIDLETSKNVADQLISDDLNDEESSLNKEDSVSMSYSTFSRFNRRNRKNSESAEEESDAESDISKISSVDNNDESESEADSVDSLIGNIEDLEQELISFSESSKDKKTTEHNEVKETLKASDKNDKPVVKSQESKQTVSSTKASNAAKSRSRHSSSSSSSSSSNSSSDSDSGSSSSRQSSPKAQTKPLSKMIKQTKKAKSRSRSRSQSPPVSKSSKEKLNQGSSRDNKSDTGKHKLDRENVKETRYDTKTRQRRSESHSRDSRDSFDSRKNKNSKMLDERKSQKENVCRKSPVVDKRTKMDRNYVEADPEFDAANYRDEKFIERKSRHSESAKWSKKAEQSEKYGRGNSNEREKNRTKRPPQGEIRHFKDIGKTSRDKGGDKRSDSRDKRDYNQRTSKRYDTDNSRRRQGSAVREDKSARRSRSPYTDRKGKREDRKQLESGRDKTDRKAKLHDDKRRENDKKITSKESSEDLKGQMSSEKLKKRKSIEEKLKSLAAVSSDSSDSSDSDKSVSSLSESLSDSEAETWRDKKQGGTRKSFDLELERKQRRLKERQEREEEEKKKRMEMRKESKKSTGDRDWRKDDSREDRGNRSKGGYKDGDRKFEKSETGKRAAIESRLGKRGNDDFRNDDRHFKPKLHQTQTLDNRDERGKKFEEISSESDTDVKHKGVVSVIRNDRAKSDKRISDLKISKSRDDHFSEKPGRLLIQVQRSSDEDEGKKEKLKKKLKVKKHKKCKSSFEEDVDDTGDHNVKSHPTVKVTFDKDSVPKRSVKDRLGAPVHSSQSEERSKPHGIAVKRSSFEPEDGGGKKLKLEDGGRKKSKHKHKHIDAGGDGRDKLDLRIQKIKEKNAQILLRKQEIEADKQKYG